MFSAVAAPLLGLGWKLGVVVGSAAMAGDLVSSFELQTGLSPTILRSPSTPRI
jgi:hypothetical protein